MGVGRQTTGWMVLATAFAMLPALSTARAQEPVEDQSAEIGEFSASPLETRVSEARWYGSADAFMLMRDSTPGRPFATLGVSGDVVLDAKDLEAAFAIGPRVTLGRRLGAQQQLEFTWFDLAPWSDRVAVSDLQTNDLAGLGNLFSPLTNFGNPAVPLLDYNNLAVIEYHSKLENMELNLRRQVFMPPGPLALSLLVGARYTRIREHFGYHAESMTPVGMTSFNTVNVDTGNELWGVQLGALFEFQTTYRSRITLDLKGGIFNNHADQGTVYTHSDPLLGQSTYVGSRAENVTSWAGELRLALTFQITPQLTSEAGYGMFWVHGVALGSENFESSLGILTGGPADLRHDGYVIYHGPHIGLVLRL